MDPYNHNMAPAPTPSSRAEADRWLAIAEKLLANRDLVGSKTFAIRARESDPRLESADQILALADTLIASDKHIIINNNNNNNNNNNTSLPDWYSVLQLPPLTSDSDLIAAHYRGLAILLNPNRSRLPFAHQAFQIVSDAWSVLSNPQQKSVYDRQIAAVHHNNNNNNINNNNNNESGSGFDANAGGHDGDNGTDNHQGTNSRAYEMTNPREDVNAGGWAAGPGGNDADNGNNVRNADGDNRGSGVGETFWTACPYCYNMYEYPKAYEECTMRCQNCRRAFHGAKIPSPPLEEREGEGEGEGETTYATWGFYPLGVSMSMMEKNKGGVANWTPFSPMFSCPSVKVEVVPEEKKKKGRMPGPVVYIDDEDEDDDDVFFDDSESSEESDDEWGSTRKKPRTKKRRSGRRRGRGSKTMGRSVRAAAVDDVAKEGGAVVNKTVSGKKQVGKAMKERGKLDLNVEFNNNEVEENANGAVRGGAARVANGEEDGEIEGIGFFEGLDEFLSSLPILNVVGDDKVKAA